MLPEPTLRIVNQVIRPGSLFWQREKRALFRRWKRAMLLPETILLAGLIIISATMANHFGYRPGQKAMASNAVIEEGAISPRKQHALQDRLSQNPDMLLKLTGDDMVRAFSYADLQRHEDQVYILQFRGQSCVLDVYYNGQDKSGPSHYEFRARELAKITGSSETATVEPRACVDDIMKSRHT